MTPEPLPALVLASGSRYRVELLTRLRLPFEAVPVDVDESAQAGESPQSLAERLAQDKAEAGARLRPGAWVIGSDQTVDCGGRLFGKPGTLDKARAQLSAMAGQQVRFHTAVNLYRGGPIHAFAVTTLVKVRSLAADEIERYLLAEPALDCAGSFRCEGLGISLFDTIESPDPTALIGLPLIPLAAALRREGYRLP